MSNLVILDDQSAQIKYTELWTGGGADNYYDHTASSSHDSGATMTFAFSGTFASVVGSFDANTTCSGSFTLDANTTTFVSPGDLHAPLYHQTIWSSAPLPDGPHTLTYTFSSCSSSSSNVPGYVWFDYILYTPSSNASTTGLLYFLDDNDSRINYSGNWTVETNNDEDFGLGSHGGHPGSSFQLQFEGTSVSVYGRIGNDSVGVATQASFSIDGASPLVFSTPYQSSVSYNQPLFQSDSFEPGQHTLVATSQSGTVWVDYLLLQPDPSTVNTTLTSTHHSSVDIGEITGVALGALVLAVGIAMLVIFRRRLFKGHYPRTAARSRPSSRPPDINVSHDRDAASSHHIPWQSENTYPPTLTSSSGSREPLNPFDTPPVSPRSGATFSSGDSRSALSAIGAPVANASSPLPWSTTYASSSGHSRRIPSLGGSGDGDSVADLKRRQQLAPAYEDSSSITDSNRAMSRASSLRPLPVIPQDTGQRSIGSGSGYTVVTVDPDDLPPVYTLREG
ncbi:hypothetical protein DFH07DRAFT_951152 [Mycena maculata]|uniref:Uncharacterized protein n=1 Tax=Mycena maculata TaxID=230809 RepID=A0AAD7NW47_9AGAR|nr:hypothetical protein DFH07DRAFT_951152 [Mycena maculata]